MPLSEKTKYKYQKPLNVYHKFCNFRVEVEAKKKLCIFAASKRKYQSIKSTIK